MTLDPQIVIPKGLDELKLEIDCRNNAFPKDFVPQSILLVECVILINNSTNLTLFRMAGGWKGGGVGGAKRPPYQFFPCNFYKRRN